MVSRSLDSRVGIVLNARNRIAVVQKGSPAERAGLHRYDLVKSVDGKPTEGRAMAELVDADATEIRFVIERPPKSQWKAIRSADNSHEEQIAATSAPVPIDALDRVEQSSIDVALHRDRIWKLPQLSFRGAKVRPNRVCDTTKVPDSCEGSEGSEPASPCTVNLEAVKRARSRTCSSEGMRTALITKVAHTGELPFLFELSTGDVSKEAA